MGNSPDREEILEEQVKPKDQLLKVILCGDAEVGKTALMRQYVQKKFSAEYKATIGADFMIKDVKFSDQKTCLQIWDTAGQERFQSLGVAFYRGADVVVFVFDLTNQKSFDSLEKTVEEFMIQWGGDEKEREKLYVAVVGTKSDKIKSGECERGVEESLISQFCMEHGNAPYFETSALENLNVEKLFEAVVKREPSHWSCNVKPAKQGSSD